MSKKLPKKLPKAKTINLDKVSRGHKFGKVGRSTVFKDKRKLTRAEEKIRQKKDIRDNNNN